MQLVKRFLSFALAIAVFCALAPAAQAQQTIITVGMPDYLQQYYTPALFDSFEAEHGVSVEVVDVEFPYFPDPAFEDLDTHLDAIANYVDDADVLFVTSETYTVEATRAGYFLDLAPLVAGDATFDAADFYPAAWQAFQWDNGIWGLPAAVDIICLQYIPQFFDEVGLAYPTGVWTTTDLANAARAIGQHYDDQPGLLAFGPMSKAFLWYALGGGAWYDAATLPEFPNFGDPALVDTFTALAGLYSDGSVYVPNAIAPGTMPLVVYSTSWLRRFSNEFPAVYGLSLPGDLVGMTAEGYAVSGGTPQPELAYELAKYLTVAPEAAYNFSGHAPARQSLAARVGESESVMAFTNYLPENEAFLDGTLMRAVPASAVRYSYYLDWAFNDIVNNGTDPAAALQRAEALAFENLQAAADRRGEVVVDVAQPAQVELAPGEIALTFITSSLTSMGPDKATWQAVVDAFVASDPEVRHVEIDDRMSTALQDFVAESDCFTLPYNGVPSLGVGQVFNLDPFLDADPAFDRADVMGNALARVQRDNQVWAYPLSIQPEVLRYDTSQFSAAGLPMPAAGWTTEQFIDALLALKGGQGAYPPFAARLMGGDDHILLLVAAHGGLPIDYRITPPTINFTDPVTVEAIRQVLDMALGGYIEYSALAARYMGGGGGGGGGSITESQEAIIPSPLHVLTARIFADSPYEVVAYPRGSQYAPMTYQLATGYISAQTAYPEACYRWISYIAQRPELFESMPARRSLLDNPDLAAVHGQAQVEAYRALDTAMQAPDTVIIPPSLSIANGTDDYFLRMWLFRAFDRYVLEGADLGAELAAAQQIADAYRGCTVEIPPPDPAIHTDPSAYLMGQYFRCASLADPDMQQ